jgi:hypothetical protein
MTTIEFDLASDKFFDLVRGLDKIIESEGLPVDITLAMTSEGATNFYHEIIFEHRSCNKRYMVRWYGEMPNEKIVGWFMDGVKCWAAAPVWSIHNGSMNLMRLVREN